jgi:hypothetical protein
MDEIPRIGPGEEPLVQTTVARRKLKMLLLLKQEVDRLVAGYSSPCLGLFCLFFGAFVCLWITDITAGIAEPTKRYFVDATVASGLASIAFGVLAFNEWRNSKKIIADLENEKGVDVDVSLQTRSNITEQKD